VNGLPTFFKPVTTPVTNYNLPQPGFYYDDQGNAALSGTTPVQNPVSNTPASPTNYIYTAGVQVYYDSNPMSGGSPTDTINNAASVSTTYNPISPQSMATVVITVRKISSPNAARVYTGYIGNNGL
jgi:hypothetical protein